MGVVFRHREKLLAGRWAARDFRPESGHPLDRLFACQAPVPGAAVLHAKPRSGARALGSGAAPGRRVDWGSCLTRRAPREPPCSNHRADAVKRRAVRVECARDRVGLPNGSVRDKSTVSWEG